MKNITPFDFVKQINSGKRDLIRDNPELEKHYTPYIVNRALAYHNDTIFYANEMNKYWNLPNKLQFSFLLEAIPKGNRYKAWIKAEEESHDTKLLMKYYDCNKYVAKEYLALMTRVDIEKLRDSYEVGGVN